MYVYLDIYVYLNKQTRPFSDKITELCFDANPQALPLHPPTIAVLPLHHLVYSPAAMAHQAACNGWFTLQTC